ncbi:MAG: hypothetical protein GVY26_00120 [Bacteroidetes bacterium]|jgi:hypothetical protein|nr:hypothetical protein [Bacteroidota bacterium]
MKTTSNFSRTVKSVVSFPIFLFVLGMFLSGNLQGQAETDGPCKENEFPFTGVPETTLCEELGDITYDLFIGVGTPITHSSQISPLPSKQIRIVGDFTIDNNFLLDLAVVNIDPGVSILMDANATLTIDNSKLFACTGMWNGIVMSDFTTVRTRNNTEIEDAEAAIQSIDKAYTFLEVENTTFNRDRIGIRLENAGISPHSPAVFVFRDNTFECDAPLSGTVDEITEVGVQIKNVYSAFFDNPNSNNNLFRNIQNGITAEGKSTDLNIYDYEFFGVRDKGIDFEGRSLQAVDCTFEHIQRHGIHFHEAQVLELSNNNFYIRETGAELIYRYMVQVENPLPGNSINISDGNYFYSEGILDNWVQWGIHLSTNGTSGISANVYGQ